MFDVTGVILVDQGAGQYIDLNSISVKTVGKEGKHAETIKIVSKKHLTTEPLLVALDHHPTSLDVERGAGLTITYRLGYSWSLLLSGSVEPTLAQRYRIEVILG